MFHGNMDVEIIDFPGKELIIVIHIVPNLSIKFKQVEELWTDYMVVSDNLETRVASIRNTYRRQNEFFNIH